MGSFHEISLDFCIFKILCPTIYKVDFFMEIETLATCFKDMYHIYNFYNNFKKIWDNKVNLISGPVNIPVHEYVHAPDSVCIYLKSDG